MPDEPPRGTVTFLFTDIEGSTRLLRRLGDGYGDVLARHRRVLRDAFARHDGYEFGAEGDALFVAFRRARDAAAAAAAGQQELAREPWPDAVDVRVRMGLHTGEPDLADDGYVGLVLHRAARISASGHGGQILLSSTTRELVADDLPGGLSLRDLGEHRLRDLERSERIYELEYPGMAGAFPPIGTPAVPPAGAQASGPALVGRARELADLESALAAAHAATGALVLVEGPAGIGKTTLLGHARERGAASGMTVLAARATELERDYPLGVARQALEPVLRRERARDHLLRGAAHLAGPVLLDVPHAPDTTPLGILHGLYWLVANLAEESPVLLVVDDAQWADESSLRFLAYLARRVEGNRIALLIGARAQDDASAHPDAALADIRAEAATRHVEPAPLDRADVGRMLGELADDPVDAAFAAACHDATGGNPFLLGELLRALRADDVPFTAVGAARVTEVTPPTVARTAAATLSRLGPEATALARATAILGGGVGLEQAARLAGLAPPRAAEAAAGLVGAGLLEDEVLLEFRHPILAGAVRAGSPARERAGAHARAARLLRADGAPPDRLGVQLLHAAPAGEAQVVADLRRAAEHATERGAPGTAAALLRRALAEPPGPGHRGNVLLELGRAERAVGRTTEAVERFEAAYQCAEDPASRARAVAQLVQSVPGEPAQRRRLVALAEETLAELAADDRELALRLHAIRVLHGGSVAGLSLEGASLGEAIVLGNLVFARTGARATAAEVAELAERAAPWADELLRTAPSLAFTGIALALTWTDRLDAAQRLLDRGVATTRRLGAATDYANVMTLRARMHQRAGRLGEAEADARAALAVDVGPDWAFVRGLSPLISCLTEQGRLEDALEELMAAGLDGEIADAPPMTPVLLARMRLYAARRDHARALSDWGEALRRVARMQGVTAPWIEDLAVIAEVHRACGDEQATRADVEQALELARGWGTPTALGQALHAQARVGLAADPVAVLREAVGLLATSPVRLEHARALVTLGGVLRRAGRRSESRDPLREGYELARRGGALALAESARGELRASGIRLRREALRGADALTPSERRIAVMAADGLANAEIAQELFLTVKTVEMHLTSAYRKLDIRRRADLARALA